MARTRIERRKSTSSYQFGTAEQVETYASLAERFVRGAKGTQLLGSNFFDSRIKELKKLKSALLESERSFFNHFRLSGTPRECLMEMQDRIDAWNSTGAINLISGRVGNVIQTLIGMFESVDLEELSEKYGNELFQQQIFEEIVTTDGKAEIYEVMNKFVRWVEELSGKGTRGTAKIDESGEVSLTGILKYIEITQDESGRFHLSFKGNISNNYKTRLAQIFNKMVKDEESKIGIKSANYASMKSEIAGQILQLCGIAGEPAAYIRYEIEQRFSQYGYSQNPLVIKGFLGEVYWNAFFSYLMRRFGSSVPTGVVKDTHGKSITIDMVVKGFGFQIKNYNISTNGEVTFHGDMGAGNLIVNRAQITPSDALLYLFGTWAYNQPVDTATDEYKNMYDEITELIQSTSAIFQMYADRIIGLDKTFSARANSLGLYQQENLYYNTFFLINTKMVPGSSIIQAIIESMETRQPTIRFEADYYAPKTGLWPDAPPKSSYAAAQMAGVNYDIHLNVNDIIKRAYERADDV